ncbi:MAG: hypothetical protein WKF91_12870 [Segetibacter sp.]
MDNWTENQMEGMENNQQDKSEEGIKLRKVTDKIGTWALILGKIIEATLTILALFKGVKKP